MEKLASDVLKQNEQGQWVRHYDLKLAIPVVQTTAEQAAAAQQQLWALYDAIRCPTLLVRGNQSDLLLSESAEQMQKRGPCAKLVEIDGVGHAPTFVNREQIAIVREFLI